MIISSITDLLDVILYGAIALDVSDIHIEPQEKEARPHRHAQELERAGRRGPAWHGSGICQGAGRGYSARHDSRAARPRHGAAGGGCGPHAGPKTHGPRPREGL